MKIGKQFLLLYVCMFGCYQLFAYKEYELSSQQCSDFSIGLPGYGDLSKKLYESSMSRLDCNSPISSISNDTIPQVIHFIWLGGKLPYIYNFCIQSWARHHPDWEIILWDDEKIRSLNMINDRLFNTLDNFGAKVDVLLLEILNQFGGIYVDIDFFCLKPFDNYVNNSSLMFGNMTQDCIGYGLIGSSKNHPFINYAIEKLRSSSTHEYINLDQNAIMEKTGPIYITRCFYEYMNNHKNIDSQLTLFAPSYLYSFPNTKRDEFWSYNKSLVDIIDQYVYPETLAVHLWSVSWAKPRSDNNPFINRVTYALDIAGREFTQISTKRKDGATALHAVILKKDFNHLLRDMILAGADINATDCLGNTPLIWAVNCENFGAVDILLDFGADPKIKNAIGKTALDIAVNKNNQKICGLIKSAKKDYKPALMPYLIGAVLKNDLNLVESMLRHGFDPNVKDNWGRTPLSCASKNNDKIRRLLLTYGASDEGTSKEFPKVIVLTCSYNNRDYCGRNLYTIFSQNYPNWELYYIDDASTDGTAESANGFINEYEVILKRHGFESRTTLVKNKIRMRALANIYYAVHRFPDDAIVVMVDGDDFLKDGDENIISYIVDVYRDPNVWLTYGTYEPTHKPFPIFCEDVSHKNFRTERFFRKHPWVFSHLRTFYAGLFKKIKKEDLMINGEFLPTAYDIAIMTPMLEMSNGRFKYIDKVLYVYNNDNPICDYKIESSTVLPDYIRSKSPYAPVDRIF